MGVHVLWQPHLGDVKILSASPSAFTWCSSQKACFPHPCFKILCAYRVNKVSGRLLAQLGQFSCLLGALQPGQLSQHSGAWSPAGCLPAAGRGLGSCAWC